MFMRTHRSYFDCCGASSKDQRKYGLGQQLLDSQNGQAGSCFIDLFGAAIPYATGVTVGNAQVAW